jgi:aldose 1-epimerase
MSPVRPLTELFTMRCSLPALAVTVALSAGALAQPRAVTGPAYEEDPFGKMPPTKDKAGKTVPGPVVTRYALVNKNGVTVKCIEYGAIITEIHVPDKNGKFTDVALGFDKLDDYLAGHPYFGANAGRCANRIANAKFSLDGKEYTITKPGDGPHTLHGGKTGFDKKYWKGEPMQTAAGPSVKFSYTSPDGEEGYPGRLAAVVSYTLTENNELVIEFRATTDKTTICNLAHHSYFNLAGHNSGDVKGHEVTIAAKTYTPGDDTLIPTGKIEPVAGTPFDFTKPKLIGTDLEKAGGKPVGFDLNYVLDKGNSAKPEPAAKVLEPKSGRVLEVFTTEPGLQFYTGNFLDGSNTGKGGAVYKQYNGFCLEAQKFPDSINKPEWKDKSNVILKPGETYKQTTIYQFSVAK